MIGKALCSRLTRVDIKSPQGAMINILWVLEITESIDMMRILEDGMNVPIVQKKHDTQLVDTPVDAL